MRCRGSHDPDALLGAAMAGRSEGWRGEHLIRARADAAAPDVPPACGLAPVDAGGGREHRHRRTKGAECNVPGCDVRVYDRSVSGVCQKHNHFPDFCECRQCLARRARDGARL